VWKPEVDFRYAGRLFSETGLSYLGEIWYANIVLHVRKFDTLPKWKPEVRIRFATLLPPSWKIDMTSQLGHL